MKKLNKKVIGLGLPRTGTTSLGAALEILGYKTIQYCPITKASTMNAWFDVFGKGLEPGQALVTSAFNFDIVRSCQVMEPNAHYVYCQRNEADRALSMSNLGVDSVYVGSVEHNPFDILRELRQLLVLPLELSGAEKWVKLCDFLEHKVPGLSYPHKNASEINYVI